MKWCIACLRRVHNHEICRVGKIYMCVACREIYDPRTKPKTIAKIGEPIED